MADNWWDSSSRVRPCLDSVSSVSVTSINLFQDSDTTTNAAATTTTGGGSGGGGMLGSDPTLHMMGLGLSSQPSLDWNHTLFRDQKGDQSGYRNLLQEDHSNTSSYNHLESNQQWRQQKMYSGSSQDSSSDFKQINVRGFQLDQPPQYNDNNNNIITCQGLNSSFQNMDSYGSPSTIIQTLFGSDCNHQQQQQQQQEQDSGFNQNQGMSYSSYQSSYGGMNISGGGGLSPSNWSKYAPPAQDFSVNSPPKVQPPGGVSQLHLSNNARFWNASVAPINDGRTSFFPCSQMQSPSSTTFEDKPKRITSEMVKKRSSESSSTKRPRNENQSSLPAFKVRKEKMGDRITALQQLVSPFGKTDTASVLSEAIEYIKFLHEQVSVLSTPYMKNGAPMMQQQQEISLEGGRQELRSRGLCLVPVSSTFPVTHETTVDFWTPTFGGTFR